MSALALTFKIFRGDRLVREETLRQSVIKIGKVPSAHLRIEDDSVSRMHAILEVDAAGNVHVIDLGSTRGTFINGHKVNKAKLESGDAIQVGDVRLEVVFARTDAVIAAPVIAPVPNVVAAPPPPPVAKPAVPAPHKALFGAADSIHDDLTSAKAIEVAAMLGDSVVGVKHCIDPKSGKVSSKTYGMFAVGAACLLSSAIAFGASVHNAAFNKAGLEYTTHVLDKPAYAFRPEVLDPAFDWIAFGGFALGASLLIAGLSRARGERRTPYYRIGTAPNVELALDSAPAASFPLVAPSVDGQDFVFNYGAGMDGELVLDGQTTTLAELAASGRARPSMTTAGALELAIPARARIRARSGQTTFIVSAVPQPRQQPVSLFGALESRTMKYFAGSLAVHLCLLLVLDTIQRDDTAANIDLDELGEVATNIKGTTPDDPPPDQQELVDTTGESGSTTSSMSMKAPDEAGAAGRPDSQAQNKRMAVKDNHMDPALARIQAIEEAKSAGILGSMAAADNFVNVTGAADTSSGMDNLNAYGQMFGADVGDAAGNFGLSRSGFMHGGGCTQEPCGLAGLGSKYNTISTGTHTGYDGPGGPGGPGMRRHEAGVPRPILGIASGSGDLDQATIRRYMNRNIEKIKYCYEHELLAHPEIEGSILVQFFISPTGAVTGSRGSGFNPTVASCVGDVVGNIAFPRPNGGGVQVNYPFTFRAPK
ncbi:MAG: AgmX/PglI C-terminal domain-containing protein [Kofleriaceae bacterium]